MLKVTAAIIIQDGSVFIAQKGDTARFAHKWEFPGGKLEEGETPEECVMREIDEEFGMKIEVIDSFSESIHTFPEGQLHISAFLCRWSGGEITPTEHQDFKWVPVRALATFDFAPADAPLAKKLMCRFE